MLYQLSYASPDSACADSLRTHCCIGRREGTALKISHEKAARNWGWFGLSRRFFLGARFGQRLLRFVRRVWEKIAEGVVGIGRCRLGFGAHRWLPSVFEQNNRRSFVPFGFAQGPQDDSRKGRTRARASSGSLRCALRAPVGTTTKEQDESK